MRLSKSFIYGAVTGFIIGIISAFTGIPLWAALLCWFVGTVNGYIAFGGDRK